MLQAKRPCVKVLMSRSLDYCLWAACGMLWLCAACCALCIGLKQLQDRAESNRNDKKRGMRRGAASRSQNFQKELPGTGVERVLRCHTKHVGRVLGATDFTRASVVEVNALQALGEQCARKIAAVCERASSV